MKQHLRITYQGRDYFGQADGYVFVESPGRTGVLGQQILDHGNNCMTCPATAQALRRKLYNRSRREARATAQ